jgi:hypothetical protein
MWHRGGQDHDDVTLSWLPARQAAGSVMPVGPSVPMRAAVREQDASPFG